MNVSRVGLLCMVFQVAAGGQAWAYKSRYNTDHRKFSKYDRRYHLEYNRNRHPSEMKPVPGGRTFDQSYKRYSHYSGKYWEGYFAAGGGHRKGCEVSLAQPKENPFWLNVELMELMRQAKVLAADEAPERIIEAGLTKSPEWPVLSRELREIARYFYGVGDRQHLSNLQDRGVSRFALMTEYVFVLGVVVRTIQSVAEATEKIPFAKRDRAIMERLGEAVQIIRGSRLSIDTIRSETPVRSIQEEALQTLQLFNKLDVLNTRLNQRP
jgi:hypothetical protein